MTASGVLAHVGNLHHHARHRVAVCGMHPVSAMRAGNTDNSHANVLSIWCTKRLIDDLLMFIRPQPAQKDDADKRGTGPDFCFRKLIGFGNFLGQKTDNDLLREAVFRCSSCFWLSVHRVLFTIVVGITSNIVFNKIHVKRKYK